MVHPTNLLRSDSDEAQRFSAPIGNYLDEIDCGIKALPCFAERLRLHKLAKLSVFVVVLSLMGCIHGISVKYFKGTSHLWNSHYNFPGDNKNWLVFSDEIFVGIFALSISYWGNRIHRATWLGTLTILIAVSGGTLIIPEIHNPFTGEEITKAITGPVLCSNASILESGIIPSVDIDVVIYAYYIIYQFLFGTVIISFISHGFTYIDDHTTAKHSPALMSLALAAHEFGKQVGIYCSWMPYTLQINGVFLSPIWLTIIFITFVIGCCMAMFPKILPNVVLKKSVTSLVMIASGGDPIDVEEDIDGYFETIWRLLRNKILLLNIMSFVLIQAAIINFELFEKYFNQSKYHVEIEERDSSGYSDPSIIQFTTNLLRQPLVAVSIATSGLVIAKVRPKSKNLVIWNIVAFVLVIIIFCSTAFLNCTHGIQNENDHSITIPYCSSKCSCPIGESFQPVCVDRKTYFSPCLAGCHSYTPATKVYNNCTCGLLVTEGSCDEENCNFMLALAQVNSILSNGIVASTLVVNFVIILRSVAKRDKATALGMQLTLLGIVPYLPVKIFYHYIIDSFCEIQTEKGCQYFSEDFTIVFAAVTITLKMTAVLLSIVLLFLIKETSVFGSNKVYDHELTNINSGANHGVASGNQPPDDDIDSVEEESPFIRELNSSLMRRRNDFLSRQERIQSYLDEGELVPPLQQFPKKRTSMSSTKSEGAKSEIISPNFTSNTKSLDYMNKRDISNASNSRDSAKASCESEMSSLYRFADSIENLGDNTSQSSRLETLDDGQGFQKNTRESKPVLHARDLTETDF